MTTDSSAPRICLVCGAALTPEQRAAINARARENYAKRKQKEHKK